MPENGVGGLWPRRIPKSFLRGMGSKGEKSHLRFEILLHQAL
jgi:hypothetical protein